jgi:hypothetical protein
MMIFCQKFVRFIYQLNKKYKYQKFPLTTLRFHGFTETEYDVTSEFSTKITEITGFLLSELTRTENSPPAFEKTPAGVGSRDTN